MSILFKKTTLFIFVFLALSLHSEDLKDLLQEYNQKNDISLKTIDENKGHLILFTRNKIEKIKAKTLKDIFKVAPVIYYHENRYALPDPLSGGIMEPYRSDFIRVFIDGVEVTQGWAGSGVMLYGDINIDFADHIEFYYMIPSFETSTEPAYLTIFMYSKELDENSENSAEISMGSRGFHEESFNYGNKTDEYSYMINISHTNAKRSKVDNGTSIPLSRDFDRTQLFAYLKNDNQIFHLQIIDKNTDTLAGMSLDATPLLSETDYLNIHMDYGIDFDAHWNMKLAYDWLDTDIRQLDDNPLMSIGGLPPTDSFNWENKSRTYTFELTYKDRVGNHNIATGIKSRNKHVYYSKIIEAPSAKSLFDTEIISSAFFQDQYQCNTNELITFGMEYNHVYRNAQTPNNDLLQLRLGYIYTDEQWTFKSYIYRIMFAKSPLSISTAANHFTDIEPQTTWGTTQEIAYRDKKDSYRIMFLTMKDENGLLENNSNGKTKYFFSIFNYTHDFDSDNKIDLQLYYAYYKDIFNLDNLKDYSGYLGITNSYGNFDLYNGIVWHKNNIDDKNYFDLTSSITWNFSPDLSFTLKGQNILDKAKKTNIFRVDPKTFVPLKPIGVSPIDRRITLEMEYLF